MNPPPDRRDGRVAALLFALATGLYASSVGPSLTYGGGDGAELTVAAAGLGLTHPTGYPLFTWLGFLFSLVPFGEVARRVAMMSAVLGGGGVAILYLICRQLDVRPAAAAFAAGLFGVSTTFWSQAVITEVYAPNLFLVALTLWRLLAWERSVATGTPPPRTDRQLAVVALLLAASLGTHMSSLGFAPAFALFVLLTDVRVLARPRGLALVTAGFLLGAAQFLWLPFRAHAFDLFPNAPPDTPAGVYAYTLAAFPSRRFAFPLAALGSRVALYVRLLLENFTTAGVVLGYAGAWVLWWRRPAACWLLLAMYAVHVAFLTQFSAPDLEVFFIPSHLLFAICVGAGLDAALAAGRARLDAPGLSPRATRIAEVLALAILYAPVVALGAVRFRDTARGTDTSLADYYESVFDVLPAGSALLGARGAFGSDLAYWHRVCGRRPDVWVPSGGSGRPPRSAAIFTTRGTPPFGVSSALMPPNPWYVPVLIGGHRDLVLSRVQSAPPALAVADAAPSVRLDRDLGGATLVGYDLTPVRRAAPARLHLVTYWRVATAAPVVLSTRVDDRTIEAHLLGFGNRTRYLTEVGMPAGGTFVEAFDLVLPSELPPGRHVIGVGRVELADTGITPRWADLGTVDVE